MTRVEHGWVGAEPGSPRNLPNAITAVRTVAASILAVLALRSPSAGLLVAGYAVYWAGDILDGWVARRRGEETRFGAVADVLCDRICTVLLGIALIVGWPHLAAPVVIFLAQFALIDLALSLSFLRWPLLSPNYFALVDRPIYRWNWSPPAKALNSAGMLLLVAVTGSVLLGVVAALLGTAVKIASLVRLVGVWRTVPATIGPGATGARAAAGRGAA